LLSVFGSSFTLSHQHDAADALQENFSPHAAQAFCAGVFPTACGPVVPALMLLRPFCWNLR
jgi:hypothetical protein